MIVGLDQLLEGRGQAGLAALRRLVTDALPPDGTSWRLLDEEMLLRARVYRLRFELDGAEHSLIVKRLSLERSRREQLVVRRWLPAAGLGDIAPPLRGIAVDSGGECAWHAYDDLGDCSFDPVHGSDDSLDAVVGMIAEVHRRFAGHRLLGECRQFGCDFGPTHYPNSVGDAIAALEALANAPAASPERRALTVDRLLERMYRLRDEDAERVELVRTFGGTETVLHGDLWTTNALVSTESVPARVWLIDWDHVGVGSVSYDLSTFLLRFPASRRRRVLERYWEHAASSPPGDPELNRLFETAECARLATCAIWAALAAYDAAADWAFEDLAAVDEWFEALEPVLPEAAGVH